MQDIKKGSTTAQDLNQTSSYPGTRWRFGFVPSAEIWNGRLAMIGFISAVLVELFSGQGVLHFWGIM
ncbi:MAG: chlorophyll a/b-binding protein [Nodosilinea sp.]